MSVEQAFFEEVSDTLDIGFKEQQVLPGDDVTILLNKNTAVHKKIILSRGLHETKDGRVVVSTPGILKYRFPSSYWVETKSTFYTPLIGDQVVGIIEDKGADFYKVNIFSSSSNVVLNRLAFEGATKRNKPELKRGDIIYARVLFTHKDLDTDLTCTVASGPKKDWSSGESIYGDLPSDGLLVQLPVTEARKMLSPDCVLLNALGRHFQYEIAIGMNGMVWFKALSGTETVAIRNALLNVAAIHNNSDQMKDDIYIEAMVEKLAQISKQLVNRSANMNIDDEDEES